MVLTLDRRLQVLKSCITYIIGMNEADLVSLPCEPPITADELDDVEGWLGRPMRDPENLPPLQVLLRGFIQEASISQFLLNLSNALALELKAQAQVEGSLELTEYLNSGMNYFGKAATLSNQLVTRQQMLAELGEFSPSLVQAIPSSTTNDRLREIIDELKQKPLAQ